MAVQKELFEKLGMKKREFIAPVRDEALYQEVRGKIEEQLHEAMDTSKYIKLESHRKIVEIREKLVESYPEDDEAKRRLAAVLRTRWKSACSATTWWRSASGLTTAPSTRCVRSAAKLAFCRARTAPPCLLAAKRRRW